MKKQIPALRLSSSTKWKTDELGAIEEGAMGYMHNNGNSVYHNHGFVAIYSSAFSRASGLSVLPSNFRRCIALFTARKSIKGDWINDKDEYQEPK